MGEVEESHAGDRIDRIVYPDSAGCGDKDRCSVAHCGFALEPALSQIAVAVRRVRLQVGRLADTLG
jgi:hypothetical protein